MLSICIPSYNRPDKALKTVLVMLEQIRSDDVKIHVIDNSSDNNYHDYFEKNIIASNSINIGSLKIHRNFVNIGMSANFMKCFELADSDWVWMVSDDDAPRADAVQKVVDSIRKFGSNSSFIKFRSGLNEDVNICTTFDKFVEYNAKSKNSFNSSIFISNGVYKRKDFYNYIGIGYQYSYTYIPHFMMITYYVYDGGSIVNLNEEVVDYVVPEIGYSYSMVAGLGVGAPKNLILNIPQETYFKYQSIFFPHNDFKVMIDLYYYCRSKANLYVASYLAEEYYRYVVPFRKTKTKIILFFLKCIIGHDIVFNLLIRLLCRISKTAELHINEMKIRYRMCGNE